MTAPRLAILLVDDDVILCRGLSRSLKHRGFDVHASHCAADALDYLEKQVADIILLDWILPDRDGVALLQHMRDRGISTPVIMLTGENSVEGRVCALNRGADDYLAKPVDLEELIARVHAQVRRASGAFHRTQAGRIMIDPWKQDASVDGERIDLTPNEYAVLALLVRRSDEIVGRKELIDAAWGDKGSSRMLDVVLTRLRRKLGDAAVQFETVRNAGVCLHSDLPQDERP